jgi:hypothetical protein
MGTAAKFIQLGRRDRALALTAARTLAVTWIGLRTAGFTAVQRRASRVAARDPRSHAWCGPPSRSSVAPPSVDCISWAVRAVSRFIPGASNCLVRALATQALLGRFGYRSELRIGVARTLTAALPLTPGSRARAPQSSVNLRWAITCRSSPRARTRRALPPESTDYLSSDEGSLVRRKPYGASGA